MPDMEGFIAKGPILRKINDISKPPNRGQKISNFLAALRDKNTNPDYVQVLTDHADLDKYEESHLRQDWYPSNGKSPAYWPGKSSIEDLSRESMELAFKYAEERGLPVDCYCSEVTGCWQPHAR